MRVGRWCGIGRNANSSLSERISKCWGLGVQGEGMQALAVLTDFCISGKAVLGFSFGEKAPESSCWGQLAWSKGQNMPPPMALQAGLVSCSWAWVPCIRGYEISCSQWRAEFSTSNFITQFSSLQGEVGERWENLEGWLNSLKCVRCF